MPSYSYDNYDSYGYDHVNVRYAQPGDYKSEQYVSETRSSYQTSSRVNYDEPISSNGGYRTRVAVPEPPSYTGQAPREYPSGYGGSSTYSLGGYKTREAVPSYHTASSSYDPPHRSYNTRTVSPESSYSSSSSSSHAPRSTYSARTAAPDSSHSSYSSSRSSSYAHKPSYSTRTAGPDSSYSSYSSSKTDPEPPTPRGTRPSMNLYKVLGVSRTASTDEIKKAHRKLCLMYHPDRVTASNREEATKMMADINMAWDVLGDEKARRLYDDKGVVVGADL